MNSTTPETVHVEAPARLHLGFLDLHGDLGRQFGSIGFGLNELSTCLQVQYARELLVEGPDRQRAERYAQRILSHMGIDSGAHIYIQRAIPAHAGLGSGTQLALAVGVALARLYRTDLSIKEVARVLGRGNRSGIGLGAFTYGGFIVDGGKGADDDVPPIIAHMPIPSDWRFVVLVDRKLQGLHGIDEKAAFNNLKDLQRPPPEQLCRLVLLQLLPALAESDCAQFGAAISIIQNLIGQCFANAQGGVFSSPLIERVVGKLKSAGATGVGQSSWGPTGFAIFDSEAGARAAVKSCNQGWKSGHDVEFLVCTGSNQPAQIVTLSKTPQESITT